MGRTNPAATDRDVYPTAASPATLAIYDTRGLCNRAGISRRLPAKQKVAFQLQGFRMFRRFEVIVIKGWIRAEKPLGDQTQPKTGWAKR